MANISIIGAGSAIFSMDLLVNICARESLWGSTVTFMDINTERLNAVDSLARRYRDEVNAELEFKKTTSRQDALEGAEFVVCAVKVGGYDPLEQERTLAEKRGYYRGIGDTVSDYYGGVGAFHQLQFFLDLAHDMERICPDAYLIETANPVFEGTTLLTRQTKVNTIGVCHGHFGYHELAEALDLPPDEMTVEMAGFNHCIWLTHFSRRGCDAYPLIDQWIGQKSSSFWKSDAFKNPTRPWQYEQISAAAVDMYNLFGLFPIGDSVRSAAPWWYHADLPTKKRWYGPAGGFDSEIGWSFYLDHNAKKAEHYLNLANQPEMSLLEEFPLQISLEQHIAIIDALVNDSEAILQLNVPNRGCIDGIPDDVVVEIPALVNSSGIHPIHIGRLPSRVMQQILIPRMNRMEHILAAFVNRDREHLVLALMLDNRTKSYEQAKDLIDELLSLPWNTEALALYQ